MDAPLFQLPNGVSEGSFAFNRREHSCCPKYIACDIFATIGFGLAIASSVVDCDKRVHLEADHFFGEIAVLRRARRSATVTALARANLLILDAHDSRALMERDARVAERIHPVARGRLRHDLVTPHSDMVTEELDDPGISDQSPERPGTRSS
jgi:CRP-like cAMP-binding protein